MCKALKYLSKSFGPKTHAWTLDYFDMGKPECSWYISKYQLFRLDSALKLEILVLSGSIHYKHSCEETNTTSDFSFTVYLELG